MKTTLFAAALVAVAGSSTAFAGEHAIYTGGEKGAYHSTFCPPIPPALADGYFTGYTCTPSKGTVENISNVLTNPTNLGLVQLDVYAKWAAEHADDAAKLTEARHGIACEGLWMVTKNPKLTNFGDVLGLARRIPFVLPPDGSGSAASFAYLQSLDASGLGRARNISYLADATAVIDKVANGTGGEVGFFVQFADPTNANIKKIVDSKLTVIPVVSRDMLRAKVGDQELYKVAEFNLTADGWISSGEKVTTACTPVSIITGKPEIFTDANDHDDQVDLVKTVQDLAPEKLLPQDDRMAKLIRTFHSLSKEALQKTLDGVDAARKAIDDQLSQG